MILARIFKLALTIHRLDLLLLLHSMKEVLIMDRDLILPSFFDTPTNIKEKRHRIWSLFLFRYKSSLKEDISSFKKKDLKYLFYCYDRVFFNHYFSQSFKGKLSFSFSSRMTRSAGKIIFPRSYINLNEKDVKIEIRMATQIFLNYYEISKDKMVNGIKTLDVFEAFLLVFEHEICHLLEILFYKKTSCKGKIFRALAYNIFGHLGVYHDLPLNREVALEKYGFKEGDLVSFEYRGERFSGFVKRITKRATVFVPDPDGDHREKGMQCFKWYVPIEELKKVDR